MTLKQLEAKVAQIESAVAKRFSKIERSLYEVKAPLPREEEVVREVPDAVLPRDLNPKKSKYQQFSEWRKNSCVDDVVLWVLISHILVHLVRDGGLQRFLGLGG